MTGDAPLSSGVSPLDEAHGKRLQGDREAALRLAIAIAESAPENLGAAWLIADVLIDAGRPLLAGEVATRMVDSLLRRGDMPAAVVAAHTAERAGEDAPPLRRAIAKAFGKGSPRIGAEASTAPPPLPRPAKVTGALTALRGEPLLDRAEATLRKHMAWADPLDPDTAVPAFPFFSQLKPTVLEQLLPLLEVQSVDAGEALIVQRDQGGEAFVLVRGALKVVRREEEGETTLAALGPGSFFGEMALVSDAPRAASVISLEPVLLLAVSRQSLQKLAKKERSLREELALFCRGRMLANLMTHSAILRALDPVDRDGLMERFETCTFEPGDTLVGLGSESDGLFLIASGEVEIVGRDAEGDRIVITTLGAGDVVGEISLVLRRPATADVVATHSTVALRLTHEEFQQAIREHPGLLNELYDLAIRRDEETRTVVAQEALEAEDVIII